jgi:hypothetical protein
MGGRPPAYAGFSQFIFALGFLVNLAALGHGTPPVNCMWGFGLALRRFSVSFF